MDAVLTLTAAAGSSPPSSRRADAGSVRLGERDVAGLLLCGDMYGAPYDLLAAALGVRPDRLRGGMGISGGVAAGCDGGLRVGGAVIGGLGVVKS